MSGEIVQLWMYDLSKGMAQRVSKLLSRREIDGIWHSSIVVFDREIWFGDGITTCIPGTCHLGLPHQVMTLGTTQVDERTFDDFLAQTARLFNTERYHLLEFNCNTFTNLCAAFLTGQSIPERIQDLPIDFLSTTIGWILGPIIQSRYRPLASKEHEEAPVDQPSQGYVGMVWSTGARAAGAVVSTSSNIMGSSLRTISAPP